ncbi:MAG: hypothetical protein J6J93_10150 [Muribaculaceae bacterium]|nr:hypothetical protein [Muribaculaceae bacterium]
MVITIAVVITSQYLKSFQVEAVTTFRKTLSSGLQDYNTPLVEELSVGFTCVTHEYSKFFIPKRPKYYADKTVKIRGSVTPEIKLYKCLDFEYVQDFESYQAAADSAECLKLLSLTFIDTVRNMKYPGALKKFDKEDFCRKIESICIDNGFISPADLETPIS